MDTVEPLKLTAIISQEDDWFVSICPELDVASQGRTGRAALRNLKKAVHLYLEDDTGRLRQRFELTPA